MFANMRIGPIKQGKFSKLLLISVDMTINGYILTALLLLIFGEILVCPELERNMLKSQY